MATIYQNMDINTDKVPQKAVSIEKELESELGKRNNICQHAVLCWSFLIGLARPVIW